MESSTPLSAVSTTSPLVSRWWAFAVRDDGVVTPDEVARSSVSLAVFRAWTKRTQRDSAADVLRSVPVPGAVAVRARYRHLLDPGGRVPDGDVDIDLQLWIAIIEAETAGDLALVESPSKAAQHFAQAATLERSTLLRVVTVNALQGAGDAARQADDHDVAAPNLIEALDIAAADSFRFGEMRALVSLGYLTMAIASAGQAREYFDQAMALAAEIPDPLFEANAQLGAAESALRLHDPGRARRFAEEALERFDTIGSHMGAGNAAERLASVQRSLGDAEAVSGALTRALRHYEAAGSVIGRVNALDGLGDAESAAGNHVMARRHFTSAIDIARHNYPRGMLNAQQGLARTARAQESWEEAKRLHELTLAGFEKLEDLVGQMHSLDGLAFCARAQQGAHAELEMRVGSVRRLEQMRAARPDHSVQMEYRRRFIGIYRAAMRVAVELGDIGAAVFVLECLCGRRLAGLIESLPATGSGDTELAALVTAMADQRLTGRLPTPESRTERITRMLGATALRHGLADRARDELDDLAATVFLPLDPADAAALLDEVPRGCHVLLVAGEATSSGESTYVWRRTDGSATLGTTALPPATLELLNGVVTGTMTYPAIENLAPLSVLLPDALRKELVATDDEPAPRLLLVPVGSMWLVPWPAITLAEGRVLGEVVELIVCPSLTVHRSVSRQGAARSPRRPSSGATRH